MKSFYIIIILITIMAEILLGTFANIFIALVNGTDCCRKKKISMADQILTALGLSRTTLLLLILVNFYSAVMNPALFSKEATCIICTAWAITDHLNTWLATALSIFYLLKIANFSNLVFLRLKRKVKSVIVVVVLASIPFLFPTLMIKIMCEEMKGNEQETNLTWKTTQSNTVPIIVIATITLDNAIPVAISLMCLLLLIFSLCKHLRTMKLYGKGSQDASITVHMKALQTVVSFLLLFALFFLSLMVSGWNYMLSLNDPIHLICQVIGILYPTSHSFILIWGNKKLKQRFVLVMMTVRFWLKERKHIDPSLSNRDMM